MNSDAMLVEFASDVDAVTCAMTAQRKIVWRNDAGQKVFRSAERRHHNNIDARIAAVAESASK